jgi:ribose 5-phosphate isomerase B
MRVYLGSDHAGLETKNAVIQHLRAAGHETIDCGAHVYDALDDYPAFCIETARRVVADEGSLGIVLGGSGNGEQIAAHKVRVRDVPWRGTSRLRNWPASTTTLS